ncbi:hypothetical protein [Aliterella atlantica]|uniref:Uncharacterized protein n=1 Tax=Aliterella atlantica CENA595 TaxID=1618023 RepID=A0A0D8ZLQ2_9CYAN|nr:hypothetical protein [Aliterella atlantica]KJH69354.1 hypothetical protein UH38_24375 [Aliterella atlantica CENA595]
MVTQQEQSLQVATPKTWDKATTSVQVGDYIRAPFTPVMQVIDKDIYPDGQTWLLVKPTNASFTEQWVVEPEQEPQSEFEQGLQHGQNDSAQRLHPIYAQANCQYSAGYVQGYNGKPIPQQTKAPAKPLQWSVTYNDKWQWYVVWVNDRAIGRALTSEEAERIAQKYIAGEKFWQEHRGRVLAAYAH